MHVSATRLPRLLGILVIAFAQFEDWPLLGAVELFRGLSIQLAYRWATGQVIADPGNRAVLLWSANHDPEGRRRLVPELLGAVAATGVGVALLCVSSAILLVPVDLVLRAAGVDDEVAVVVAFSIVGARWLATCWRALRTYQDERALMTSASDPVTLTWRLDYLAALPARHGHGGRLLDQFLAETDRCGAEVALHGDQRNVAFYRRHGFHQVDPRGWYDQRVMIRKARNRAPTNSTVAPN
jgi:GNAT superfamily N-acetyltransferase